MIHLLLVQHEQSMFVFDCFSCDLETGKEIAVIYDVELAFMAGFTNLDLCQAYQYVTGTKKEWEVWYQQAATERMTRHEREDALGPLTPEQAAARRQEEHDSFKLWCFVDSL